MELKGMKFKKVIQSVTPFSIADELRIEPGDTLIAINGERVRDVVEYEFLVSDDYLEIEIKHRNGERVIYEIEKAFEEDLGLVFESPIIDDVRSCTNECVFCFVDQLPKGMRETLYFKDDDSRLSFLQGNFVTLTNMKMNDIKRLIDFRVSPINVSVHTTEPQLRCKLLNNRFAGDILDKMTAIANAGLDMNVQIVAMPGLNDGENLKKTLENLANLFPRVNSVAIVPVGLTKFREGLFPLDKFEQDNARALIEIVDSFQSDMLKKHNDRFVYASDEFYIIANKELPKASEYGDFIQIENGVGLIRKLEIEVMEALEKESAMSINKKYSICCGVSVAPFIKNIANNIEDKFKGLQIKVYPVENKFFGKDITVTGLLTGQDIIEFMKSKEVEEDEILLLARSMFKSDELIMLDNTSIKDIKDALNIDVRVVDVKGDSLVKEMVK